METLEGLRRKIDSADELDAVVRTMKAIAASNINQFESATNALKSYYQTIELGLMACFQQKKVFDFKQSSKQNAIQKSIAIVFGSDQGLVGQFNEVIADFTYSKLKRETVEIWSVGERVHNRIQDLGFQTKKLYPLPGSLNAITVLVSELLTDIEETREKHGIVNFYLFHNQQTKGTAYEAVYQQMLPLNFDWEQDLKSKKWDSKLIPEVLGNSDFGLFSLIKEYLFVSIYKACAESLASENASRLAAMQRAEKNIDEILEELHANYHQMRQNSIDEELFDVTAAFEVLRKKM